MYACGTASLVDRAPVTGQDVQGSKLYSCVNVCSELDSTLNGGPCLFCLRVQKMTAAPVINQPTMYSSLFHTNVLLVFFVFCCCPNPFICIFYFDRKWLFESFIYN